MRDGLIVDPVPAVPSPAAAPGAAPHLPTAPPHLPAGGGPGGREAGYDEDVA
jgi:hypothetical protein